MSIVSLFLMAGAAAGLSAQVMFYSLFLSGKFNPAIVITAHVVLLPLLFLLNRSIKSDTRDNNTRSEISLYVFFGVFVLFVALLIAWVCLRPYGDWDAWALWNFRANFIFRAGERWQDILHFNLHGHQPWFLPFLIASGWAFSGHEDMFIPMAVAVLATVLVIGLVVYGLSGRVSRGIALLAGVYLCSIPYFLQHAASQYADIWVAYYLLAAVIGMERGYMFLSGIFWGLLCLSKNEGMVLAVVMLVAVFMGITRSKELWRPLMIGLACILPSVLIPQMLMTGDPAGINKVSWVYLGDMGRWRDFVQFFFQQVVFGKHWGGLWIIAPLLLALFRKRWDKYTKVYLCSLAVFLVIFMALYVMVCNDFQWRMAVSLDRLMFQIAPLMVYLTWKNFPDLSSRG